MPTTTIRLDEEMKMRITKAAERGDEFHRVADERWTRIVATGEPVSWDDMRAQLQARAQAVDRPGTAARKTSPPKSTRG